MDVAAGWGKREGWGRCARVVGGGLGRRQGMSHQDLTAYSLQQSQLSTIPSHFLPPPPLLPLQSIHLHLLCSLSSPLLLFSGTYSKHHPSPPSSPPPPLPPSYTPSFHPRPFPFSQLSALPPFGVAFPFHTPLHLPLTTFHQAVRPFPLPLFHPSTYTAICTCLIFAPPTTLR